MGKEDSGRLLSKVAKFVRNPLKDWSELDAQESVPADNGYSREMLKEMIERRQRNDFVRRREFDMLRKLRQREAAGGTPEGAAAVSSFNLSTSGKSEGRALTLKKIDEIEEQMSQQWWKGRGQGTDVPGTSTAPAAPEAAAPASEETQAERRARAYADTEPGVSPPPPHAEAAVAMGAREGGHPSSLEDAAIRFAQSDDAGAEAVLLQMTAQGSPQAEHNDVWRALLDFYRAIGDAEKFGAASTRYAQRLKRPGPEWISLRSLARDAQAGFDALPAEEASPTESEHRRSADWHCPALLTREGLAELTRALAGAGPVWHMDWRALTAIDHDAAAPLRALFNHWADSPVQLNFTGAGQLLGVLEKAAPTGDKSVDVVWWQLRMAVLRTVHEPDAYELAALNYCITYEVSPPSWLDPRGSYTATHEVEAPAPARSGETGQAALVGYLGGDCKPVLQRLDAQMISALMPTVSCAALLRVDLEGARALIDWVAGHEEQGRRIEFIDVHRLVATFFHVVGITDHASVSIRSK
ncbi:MAG TPA: STAS domain-containing protein [Variovorax sp.]|nr:STAS domain-containing protein [Variovorax sp.]